MKQPGEIYLTIIISDKEIGPFKTYEQVAHYIYENNVVNFSAIQICSKFNRDITSVIKDWLKVKYNY